MKLRGEGDNIRRAEIEWSNRGMKFHPEDNNYAFFESLFESYDEIDEDINALFKGRFLDTAEGEFLDEIAKLIGVQRRSGESDASFRQRLRVEFAKAQTTTTFDETRSILVGILDIDADEENVEMFNKFSTHPATLFISIPTEFREELEFDMELLLEVMNEVVSAGHRVIIEIAGSFEFTNDEMLAEDGHVAEKGLTGDGVEGGTIREGTI